MGWHFHLIGTPASDDGSGSHDNPDKVKEVERHIRRIELESKTNFPVD
jgi:hypothetical protein